MHIAEILAENFRVFGTREEGKALQLKIQPGINALVGENDGGKSAIIDAIRFCLWTTSQEYHRLSPEDFHCHSSGRTDNLVIRCKFEDLSVEDQATFLEWLTSEDDGRPVLYVHLRATLLEGGRRGKVAVETHSGPEGERPAVERMMRELLKTTYLRPLRDAEAELSPGRNSRLSQILVSHPEIASQAEDDFDEGEPSSGKTLVGIMKRAEHQVKNNEAVQTANDRINNQYLAQFQLGPEALRSEVGVAGDTTLGRILEKLELVLAKPSTSVERTRRGLGYNNALFMSAELLLLGSREAYPTLLIEEPEAHLHPQMQASVVSLLSNRASPPAATEGEATPKPVQVILTTHSPNLASAISLDRITIVCGGNTYPLQKGSTKLSADDYAFLERFLDSTKSNLFFARGVAIVEGDAENLLLPALAEATGFSFRANGVSVVNVGHTGLFRYSNILRRSDGSVLPIRVACLRDRDVVPDHVPDAEKGSLKKHSELSAQQQSEHESRLCQHDGEAVKTFISDVWTFEYDLAAASWQMADVMHWAVQCALEAKNSWPDAQKVEDIGTASRELIGTWKAAGKTLDEVAWLVFASLKRGQASKSVTAQFAAQFVTDVPLTVDALPTYLQQALKYLAGEADASA